MGRKLENKNATSTEIELYRYAGIYLVEATRNSLRYAPVHFGDSTKDFPFVIEDIEDAEVEWDQAIIFDKMSETVLFQGKDHLYDADVLAMIVRRTEELQFEKPIFDGIFGKCEDKGSVDERKGISGLQSFINKMTSTAFKFKEQNEFCFDLVRWSKDEPYWCVFACEHGTGGVSGIKGAVTIGGHFCIRKEENFHGVLDTLINSGWKVEIHTDFFADYD